VQKSVEFKNRAPKLRPKKQRRKKKHRRVPACNLQPSQFNFDRGLQYEYQKKASNLNIYQIFNKKQLRDRPAPNSLRVANIRRFLSSIFFQFLSEQLYVF